MSSKVISFEYSAAYAHAGATRCLRENKYSEALELMRQAVEKAPDNREYQLDLAELYCEMGQIERSDRVLLDMAGAQDAPAECFYGLAINQARRGNEDYAKLAIAAYWKRCNGDEDEDTAEEILDILEDELPGRMEKISYRRTRREQRKLKSDPLTRDRTPEECLCDMFEHDPEGRNIPPIMRYFYVLELKRKDEYARAEAEAKKLANDTRLSTIELTMSAQMLWENGFQEDAIRAARRVLKMETDDIIPELLEPIYIQADMHEELAEFCRLQLQRMPYEKKYLHMRAVALHKSGAEDMKAANCWYKITQIDPDDAIAQYWMNVGMRGQLSENQPDYVYRVPENVLNHWCETIDHTLQDIHSDIEFDHKLRMAIMGVLNGADADMALNAVKLLAYADDSASISILREYLYRETTDAQTRAAVREIMIKRGVDVKERFPSEEIDPAERMPQLKDLLPDVPIADRQLVRNVNDVLLEHYHCAAGARLLKLWNEYRFAADANRLESAPEAAAALAWNYLLSVGEHPIPEKLAKQFRCSNRRMIYYARHMAAVIEGCAKNEDH